MQLNAPKKTTWLVALVLGVIGLIAYLFTIPVLTALAFWLVLIGLILMLVAAYLPNL
jgi:hypothetical protein